MQCRLKNCLFGDNKEIRSGDEVKVGSVYYHKKCYEAKENIAKTIDLFRENINANATYAQLTKVCSDIVYTKKNDSALLLFGLEYYINHHISLNYPGGLYYVIQNKDVIKEWSKLNTENQKKSFEILEFNQPTFIYKPVKQKNIEDIFG